MKLDTADIIAIAPRIVALAEKIAAAFRSEGPGGKRLTRDERKEIAGDAWELAGLVFRALL